MLQPYVHKVWIKNSLGAESLGNSFMLLLVLLLLLF